MRMSGGTLEQAAADGGPVNFAHSYYGRHAQKRFVEGAASLYVDEEGRPALQSIFIDMTEAYNRESAGRCRGRKLIRPKRIFFLK